MQEPNVPGGEEPGEEPGQEPGNNPPPSRARPLKFERLTVDGQANGPAFSTTADINGDGKMDLVVSHFGRISGPSLPDGEVVAYLQGANLNDWTKITILPTSEGLAFPNEPTVADVDVDGDLDVLVPGGFFICPFLRRAPCGALLWMEQTTSGWARHDIVAPGAELFYHRTALADVDGDGIMDIVTGAEEGKAPLVGGDDRAVAQWFKGTNTPDRFESTPREIGPGLGSLPMVVDVDGDGDLDVAGAEYFAKLDASFVWFEQLAAPSPSRPAGQWARHVIDADSGPSIQFSMAENFLGDGRRIGIGSNHSNTAKRNPDPWESAITMYEPTNDLRAPWRKTIISEGIVSRPGGLMGPQHAPGIFAHGDIDGDGDQDLLVSGDGDPRVFLIEQKPNRAFRTHVLDTELGQAGSTKIVDFDGDNIPELVASSYEGNVIHMYRFSPNGTYPASTGSEPGQEEPSTPPPANPTPGTIRVNVSYDGAETGQLVVAAFPSLPPAGPPVAFRLAQAQSFPVTVELANVRGGTAQVLVFLDLPPNSIMSNGPEDPVASSAPLVVNGDTVEVDLALGRRN